MLVCQWTEEELETGVDNRGDRLWSGPSVRFNKRQRVYRSEEMRVGNRDYKTEGPSKYKSRLNMNYKHIVLEKVHRQYNGNGAGAFTQFRGIF